MENIDFAFENGQIRIDGYPDAVKLICLSDQKSRRISDLGLHKSDLEHSLDCLVEISKLSESEKRNGLIGVVLWEQAIVYFLKCFGSSMSRFQLDFEKIFRSDSGAKVAFEYFKNLRNKHLVHDENSFAQSLTGAIINSSSSKRKVTKIVNSVVKSQTLSLGNYNNLKLLLSRTHDWVIGQFDELCDRVTDDLEKRTYSELMAFPNLTFRVPEISDVERNRGEKPNI